VEELVFCQAFVGENHGLTISGLHTTIQPFSLYQFAYTFEGVPRGFRGGWEGLTPLNPQATPRQPPGNPQATPYEE